MKIPGLLLLYFLVSSSITAQQKKVIAFFTGREDPAHISFVGEAIPYLARLSKTDHFEFDTTSNWNNMNDAFLKQYQLVLFLDSRPDSLPQRQAFEKYMNYGGAWMGFHFSGFALTPSAFNQDWNWYHNEFIGAGEYKGNTWRPTSAVLRVEHKEHPSVHHLPATFTSAPNEWYSWKNDLRNNPDIKILLSIDSSSFPLGTGPKPYEIWHTGYYPVAWTNSRYRMIYFNVGHNDMDYGGTDKTLSSSFASDLQNQFINQSIRWLLNRKK